MEGSFRYLKMISKGMIEHESQTPSIFLQQFDPLELKEEKLSNPFFDLIFLITPWALKSPSFDLQFSAIKGSKPYRSAKFLRN